MSDHCRCWERRCPVVLCPAHRAGGLRANPLTTRRFNYCGPQGQPAVKNEALSIEIQTPDIMTYLLENKGKIALYSGLHGNIRVELGLFGYLGFKYRF